MLPTCGPCVIVVAGASDGANRLLLPGSALRRIGAGAYTPPPASGSLVDPIISCKPAKKLSSYFDEFFNEKNLSEYKRLIFQYKGQL